jgi:hypothetical protein
MSNKLSHGAFPDDFQLGIHDAGPASDVLEETEKLQLSIERSAQRQNALRYLITNERAMNAFRKRYRRYLVKIQKK